MSSVGKVPAGTLALIFRRTCEILLMLRGNTRGEGTWALPGGWIEPGETLSDATWREVKEELGVECLPLHQFDVVLSTHNDGLTDVCVVMLASLPAEAKPRIMEPEKCSYLTWLGIDQVLQMREDQLFLPFRNFVTPASLYGAYAEWLQYGEKTRIR